MSDIPVSWYIFSVSLKFLCFGKNSLPDLMLAMLSSPRRVGSPHEQLIVKTQHSASSHLRPRNLCPVSGQDVKVSGDITGVLPVNPADIHISTSLPLVVIKIISLSTV